MFVCLTLLAIVWANSGPANADDFFIANKFGSSNYACVTNSSHALSWIVEDIEETLQQDSQFIPESHINDYDHIVAHFITTPWSPWSNAFGTNLSELILDRRWEKFDVHLTEFIDSDGDRLQYYPILTSLQADFEIPLSIRIKREAHIFLCDGINPTTSNCYWFMLQAWKGERSAIRKCSVGTVPSRNQEFPPAPCKTLIAEVRHSPNEPPFLSNEKWSHFMLSKRGDVLTFAKIDRNGTILELKESGKVLQVRYMIVHSKEVNGLWKIHNPEFFYTREESSDVPLGPPLHPLGLNNYVCVSIFVKMCSSCSLKLTLTEVINNDRVEEKTFRPSTSQWSEIKFLVGHTNGVGKRLLISTIGAGPDRFWAIDDVRLCQKTEARMILLSERASCQLISKEDSVIPVENLSKTSKSSDSKCPEDTIGAICLPCSWIYGNNCEKIKICQKGSCVCSAGYTPAKFNDCTNKCADLAYGHGCQKKCGHCRFAKCNEGDGKCFSGCSSGFVGPRCDKRPAITFLEPPQIRKVDYFTATAAVTDFEIENGTYNEAEYYIVEYKKADELDSSQWTTVEDKKRFHKSVAISIRNLEAGTKYFVRAVIISDRGISYDDHYVKFSEFTTKCRGISRADVGIRTTNTSAVFSIKRSRDLCNHRDYTVDIAPTASPMPKFLSTNKIEFRNLKAFTNYIVTFRTNSSKSNVSFRTREGVPDQIPDYSFTDISPSKIEIKWPNSTELHGNLNHYFIEYQLLSYVACGKQQPATQQELKTKDNLIIVDNLVPNSVYNFRVSAVNTILSGPPNIKQKTTLPAIDIEADEISTIAKIDPKATITNIELSNITCDKVRGPMLLIVKTECLSEWCANHRTTNSLAVQSSSSFSLDNLTPYANYTVQLQFCRDQNHCSNITRTQQFQTAPTVPGTVREVLVYSKNQSSVSVRWTPPYPPTGVLEEYKIEYSYVGQTKTDSVGVTPCQLWPRFHCARLSNLEENEEYTIKIYARNEEPLDFGTGFSIQTTTKKEPPEAPYELEVTWTTENNAVVEWKHPNVSNGEIQFFTIYFTNIGTNERKTKEFRLANETLIYHDTINASNLFPSTPYEFQVAANNGQRGHFVARFYTSPPDVPELTNDLVVDSANNTTATVTIFPRKIRGNSDDYRLILLISDENKTHSERELVQFDLANFRVVFNCSLNVSSKPFGLTIGNQEGPSYCISRENPPLRPGSQYNVTVVVLNSFGNQTRYGVYSQIYTTDGDKADDGNLLYLLGLLALLLLIPLAVVVYLKRKTIMDANTYTTLRNRSQSAVHSINFRSLNNMDRRKVEAAPLNSTIIKTAEFYSYVKEATKIGELKRQHGIILDGQKTYATLSNALRLEYIDMNYISDLHLPKVYVATLIPKPEEIEDFWKIVWNENIHHLVLFDSVRVLDKQNFESYWPDENKKICCGNFIVESSSCLKYEFHDHRKFMLTHNHKRRQIDQLHFLSNTGERLSTLQCLQFFQQMSKIPFSSKSPILVHSSCGMRGNGFVLLCDISIRTAYKDGSIDVLNALLQLTEYSSELIIDYDHYVLAHMLILDVLLHMDTTINEQVTGLEVQKHLEYLEDTKWLDCTPNNCIRDSNIYFRAVQPTDGGEILLAPYGLDDEQFAFTAIDGYQSPGKFLLTPFPKSSLILRFWKLVMKKNISAIFSLDDNLVAWPLEARPVLKLGDDLIIKYKTKTNFQYYNWVTVELDKKMEKRSVEIFSMKNCAHYVNSPVDISHFVNFSLETNEIVKKSDSVIVTCQDGLSVSGLYVAMSYVIQKVKYEGVCDICMCVRTIRRQYHQLLNDEEQYKLLMAAALKYLKEFKLYEVR